MHPNGAPNTFGEALREWENLSLAWHQLDNRQHIKIPDEHLMEMSSLHAQDSWLACSDRSGSFHLKRMWHTFSLTKRHREMSSKTRKVVLTRMRMGNGHVFYIWTHPRLLNWKFFPPFVFVVPLHVHVLKQSYYLYGVQEFICELREYFNSESSYSHHPKQQKWITR